MWVTVATSALLNLTFLPLALVEGTFMSSNGRGVSSFFVSSPSVLFGTLGLSSCLFGVFPLSSEAVLALVSGVFSPRFFGCFITSPVLLPLSSIT